jgi:hypothetical protein
MRDIYLCDKTDLFERDHSSLKGLNEILVEIQQLSQRLAIISTSKDIFSILNIIVSGVTDQTGYPKHMLEKILIFINEVTNIQKVLSDLVS